jgi:hypothetical protein
MSANPTTPEGIPSDWSSRSGPAIGAAGLTAGIRLLIGEEPVGVLKIADGAAAIVPDGAADAAVSVDRLETLVGLLGGEVHPVVARLQNRVRVDGDVAQAVRVFLGLQAGSPWTGLVPRREHNG